MEWFLYYFIILTNQCQIPYKTLDKALLFLRNQVFCLKNWKLWRTTTTLEFNFFCWNFAHLSYLPMSTKGCSGFFKFFLDLELVAKIENDLVFTHPQKPVFWITPDLKGKKIPNTLLKTLISRKCVPNFSRKYWTLW